MNYCPLCVLLILQRNVISIHPQILSHCANKLLYCRSQTPVADTNHGPLEKMTLSLISLHCGVDNITRSSFILTPLPSTTTPLVANKISIHFNPLALLNRNIILSPDTDPDDFFFQEKAAPCHSHCQLVSVTF